MNDTEQKIILVVDDEPMIVDVVSAYLEKAGYIVVRASTGRTALEACARYKPALVILDLMLPDLSGQDVCRSIRAASQVPVVMLTARSGEDDLIDGLALGADDYVTKPFSPRQLLARIEAVLRRTAAGSISKMAVISFDNGDLTIDSQNHEVRRHDRPIALTPNEFRLLLTLARHPNKVFSREELIACALDQDFQGNDRAIDSHIKNLRLKIEDDSRNPRYILTVHGFGYKFGGDSQ